MLVVVADCGLGVDRWIITEEVEKITEMPRADVGHMQGIKRTKIGSITFYDCREVAEWVWKHEKRRKTNDDKRTARADTPAIPV